MHEVTYRVTSLGMDLPDGKGKERHLNTGDVISEADLLKVMRQQYINIVVKTGDLEIIAAEESNADVPTG